MLKSYDELREIDVKPYCEKRDGLLYLNWAMCIDLLRKKWSHESLLGANSKRKVRRKP